MKIIIDTNVFVSGIFFSGLPYRILEAWRDGQVTLVLSPEILLEYQETGEELMAVYPEIDFTPWIELVTTHGLVVESAPMPEPVCSDPDDDKFLACALASGTTIITSGDKALLATSGFKGVSVLTPRQFVETHLN